MSDFFNAILPTLRSPSARTFNLFDVLHHGTHEKQLSNLFAWLLTPTASHDLGTRFVGWFLDDVNAQLIAKGRVPVSEKRFTVDQEQNTRSTILGGDIADIVMRGQDTALVVENFYISDGHGHDYAGYQSYGEGLTGGRAIVVMLCEIEDRTRLLDGWDNAPVVLYRTLIRRLSDYLDADPNYADAHPEQSAFFRQIKAHFLKGMNLDQSIALDFIKVMCQLGEAKRYGNRNADKAFGDSIREEAERRFVEGQSVLNTVKWTVQKYLITHSPEINTAMGSAIFDGTDISLAGIYQWDVSLKSQGQRCAHVMFGPSAWAENERDDYKAWDTKVSDPDYSRLFIGYSRTRVLRQSSVTMDDVLAFGFMENHRLMDEIVEAVRSA